MQVHSTAAEDFLEGKEINEETAEEARALFVSKAVGLRGNKYKIQVAKTLVKQATMACRER